MVITSDAITRWRNVNEIGNSKKLLTLTDIDRHLRGTRHCTNMSYIKHQTYPLCPLGERGGMRLNTLSTFIFLNFNLLLLNCHIQTKCVNVKLL